MSSSQTSECFALYLWRSPEAPGTLYLAKGLAATESLCRSLADHGYIVKIVHSASDVEYELRDGALQPMELVRPAFA